MRVLCGNGARLLSLSGGNRWKLANAKDALPVSDVTGAARLFGEKEKNLRAINGSAGKLKGVDNMTAQYDGMKFRHRAGQIRHNDADGTLITMLF